MWRITYGRAQNGEEAQNGEAQKEIFQFFISNFILAFMDPTYKSNPTRRCDPGGCSALWAWSWNLKQCCVKDAENENLRG